MKAEVLGHVIVDTRLCRCSFSPLASGEKYKRMALLHPRSLRDIEKQTPLPPSLPPNP